MNSSTGAAGRCILLKNKTKQNKTKQNKTKQNKTKQNKTKQNKTKQKQKQKQPATNQPGFAKTCEGWWHSMRYSTVTGKQIQ